MFASTYVMVNSKENVGKEIFYVYYVIGPAMCYQSHKLTCTIQHQIAQ